MKIGIIGNGFVGKATKHLRCNDIEVLVYDINPELCEPIGLVLEDLNECEIIFISVPTPMNIDGSCYLNIVNSVLKDLEKINFQNNIVLRSTVPVGTSDNLNVNFMPEFLTESNFINDFINNKDWIFGLLKSDDEKEKIFREKITLLFSLAYENGKILHNNISFLTNKEAEMVKMFRNCFLATKVSFCNEIYTYCKKLGINYNNMIQLAAKDERILHSHTMVPGPDGKYGFGGTCFPKDTASLRHEMNKNDVKPYILNAIIERNEKQDREEKDWESSVGRAVI